MVNKGIKTQFGVILVFAAVAMNVLALRASHNSIDWRGGDGPVALGQGSSGESQKVKYLMI